MDDINRKRLEWMADEAKLGSVFPAELFNTRPNGNGWGEAARECAKAALDEIDRLRAELEAKR
jgi:hypothetical protein